jgi:hypothetical protein
MGCADRSQPDRHIVQVFVVAVAITASLIIANTIRRPRASL